jgi:heat shock protein HtpX
MQSLFEQMRSNNIRSYLLIFVFFIIIGVIGALFGYIFAGDYIFGLVIAGIIAIIYTLIAYNQGKNMIMSMANAKRVDKKDYLQLFNIVEGLALAAGLKKAPEIFVIPERAMNAFATGKDPEHSAIAVTQGLIDNLKKEELEGVIAHEMSHVKNYDIRLMMLTSFQIRQLSQEYLKFLLMVS